MANLDVKILQGAYANLPESLDGSTLYYANDKSVMGAAGQLYYGKPSLSYASNKLTLWGVAPQGEGESAVAGVELGSVDLTLDSFLEDAKFFKDSDTQQADVLTWAEGIYSGFTSDDVEKAFEDAGFSESDDKSSIVMIMHKESGASGDDHTLIVIPVGKLLGDAQLEINEVEKSVGLANDGSYVAATGDTVSVTTGATTVLDATTKLDEAITILNGDANIDGSVANSIATAIDALDETVSDETEDGFISISIVEDGGLLSEVTITSSGLTPEDDGEYVSAGTDVATNLLALDTQVAANEDDIADIVSGTGLVDTGDSIIYSANTGTTYITDAKSLVDADEKLDAALAELAEQVDANAVSGVEAIVVTAPTGETGNTVVSLKLDETTSAETGSAKIDLTQSDDGLLATVKLDNTAETSATGGIGLTQDTDGTIKATLYWGSF